MAVAFDTVRTFTDNSGTNQFPTITNVTTNGANELVILFIELSDTASYCSVTGVSGGGSWTKLTGTQYTNSVRHVDVEIWYCFKATAGTFNVFPSFSAAPNSGFAAELIAFSGVDTGSPFDTGGGTLPCHVQNISSTATSITTGATTFNTSGAGRMVVAMTTNNGSSALSAGSRLGNSGVGGTATNAVIGAGSISLFSQYALNSSAVSSGIANTGGGTSTYWDMFVVALQAVGAGNTTTGTITTSLTKPSQSVSGYMKPSGTISTALTKAAQSVAGRVSAKGTIATSLSKALQSAAANVSPTAKITTNLTKPSQSATAKVSGVVAFVNRSTGGGTGTSGTLTQSVTAGNILVMAVHMDSHTAAAGRTATITDSQGNTWTGLLTSTSAQSGQIQSSQLFYCFPASTGSLTITATISGSVNAWAADCHQYLGVDTLFPFGDLADAAAATTNYTATGTSITASQKLSRASGGLVASFVTSNLTATQSVITAPSGFTGDGGTTTGSVAFVSGAYKVEPSGTTETTSWGTAAQWCLMNLSLQPATLLSLDGKNTARDTSNSLSSLNVSLQTTQPNDTLVLCVVAGSATLQTVSSVSGFGLTWQKRSSRTFSFSATAGQVDLEVWYALAPTAVNGNITVNFTGVVGNIHLHAFGVNGANKTNPWDSSVSLPAIAVNNSNVASKETSPSYSTTGPDRFMFAFEWNDSSVATPDTVTYAGSSGAKIASLTGAGLYLSSTWYYPAEASASGATASSNKLPSNWGFIVDALTASGPTTNGSITTSLSKVSQSLTGSNHPNITGTAATALTKVSQTIAGWASPRGTITTTLQKAAQSLTAREVYTGTITTTLQGISQRVDAAEVQNVAHITTRLAGISQSAAGTETMTGTIVTALRPLSQVGIGWAEIIGEIVTDLDGSRVHMQAHTYEVFTGTITTNLQGLSQSLVEATEIFTASIVTTLDPMAQSLAGELIITGTINTLIGGANASAFATVIEAELIIEGPILTSLQPFDVTALGAQLGAPGAGRWYSWRQTDN